MLITIVKIIWNPGAFISVIECACTDTFQSGKSFASLVHFGDSCARVTAQSTRSASTGEHIALRKACRKAHLPCRSFQKTNQTDFLNASDVPAVLSGLRSVCAFMSTIMGNVSDGDGETTPSASAAAPSPTSTSAAGLAARLSPTVLILGISVIFSLQVWL